jgi:hypothetical protein
VPRSTNEIIDRIFAAAKAEEQDMVGMVAERFADAYAEGHWDTPALDQILRELEEQS